MRADDMQWSTQSSAAFSDVQIGDRRKRQNRRVSNRPLHAAMQDDRPIGAVLAGLPTMPAPDVRRATSSPRRSTAFRIRGSTRRLPNVIERGHGTFQVGQKASPLAVGLRDHSMRTPGQFQQNYPRELAISEAAALAGADAIQFRIDHASEERAIGVLKAVRDASGWDTRPSPRPDAASTGIDAGARPRRLADVAQWNLLGLRLPDRGRLADHGRDRRGEVHDRGRSRHCRQPDAIEAECRGRRGDGNQPCAIRRSDVCDESGITTEDWITYPIPTMADIPEIKVVLINNPKVGAYGGGSEAATCPRRAGHRGGTARCDRKDDPAASDEGRVRAGGFEDEASRDRGQAGKAERSSLPRTARAAVPDQPGFPDVGRKSAGDLPGGYFTGCFFGRL